MQALRAEVEVPTLCSLTCDQNAIANDSSMKCEWRFPLKPAWKSTPGPYSSIKLLCWEAFFPYALHTLKITRIVLKRAFASPLAEIAPIQGVTVPG